MNGMDEQTMEVTEWAFPEVELVNHLNDVDLGTLFMPDIEENQSDYPAQREIVEDKQDVIQNNQHAEPIIEDTEIIQYQVLDKLKMDYESRIEMVNNIINQLKAPVSLINEELIELLQDIIKKIVKKIIYKEISTDLTVLPNMINELKSLIDTKNGMTSVFLSEKDYQRLEADKNHPSQLIEIDHTLSSGDIMIKSNYAEVRALLDERIEQITRIENE